MLLVDSKRRRHLVTLEPDGIFHSHAGMLRHDGLIGAAEGTTVRTARGARLLAVRPTLAEYILKMPRGAQAIYPKDFIERNLSGLPEDDLLKVLQTNAAKLYNVSL